jgi:hypothetical protein
VRREQPAVGAVSVGAARELGKDRHDALGVELDGRGGVGHVGQT